MGSNSSRGPTACQQGKAFALTYLSYAVYCLTRIPYSISKSVLSGKGATRDFEHPNGFDPFNKDNVGLIYLGSLDTIFLISYSFALFFSGWFGERLHVRYLIFLGMLGSGVSVLLFGLGLKWKLPVVFYFLCNIISGLFQSTGWPANVTVMSRWFDKRSRGVVMGVWDSHASIGNIFGKIFLTMILYKQGAVYGFLTAGIVCMSVGVVVVLFLIGGPDEVEYLNKGPAYPSANYPSHQSNLRQKEKKSGGGGGGGGGNNNNNHNSIHNLYDQNNLIEQLISQADSELGNDDDDDDDDVSIQSGGGGGGGVTAGGTTTAGNSDPEGGGGGGGGMGGPMLHSDNDGENPPPPQIVVTSSLGKSNSNGHLDATTTTTTSSSLTTTTAPSLPSAAHQKTNNYNQHKKRARRKKKGGTHSSGSRQKFKSKKVRLSCVGALMIPGVLLYSGCLFCAKFAAYSFIFWLPYYLQKRGPNYSVLAASNLSIAYDVGGVFGGIVTGHVAEKIFVGRRGTAAFVCLLLSVPTLYAYAVFSQQTENWAFHVGMLFLIGVLVSGPYSLISSSVAQDLATHPVLRGNNEAMSTVTGIIGGTGSMGAALQGVVVGVASVALNENIVTLLYVLMSIISLSALLLVKVVYKENRGRRFQSKATHTISVLSGGGTRTTGGTRRTTNK